MRYAPSKAHEREPLCAGTAADEPKLSNASNNAANEFIFIKKFPLFDRRDLRLFFNNTIQPCRPGKNSIGIDVFSGPRVDVYVLRWAIRPLDKSLTLNTV
jgi:hypothetical protein